MFTRNPSPPPGYSDILENTDKVGDTTYSRKWLFSLLVKLLQSVKDIDSKANDGFDLDSELEEELCCFWDLTVNREVLKYLDEFDIVPLFNITLDERINSRLLEILVGILANLAYDLTACKRMAECDKFISRIIALMYSRHAPILTEVCRLIHTVLACDNFKSLWIDEIRFHTGFFENLMFILASSTNGTVRLMDMITREDDSLAEVWCGSQFLEAIFIAQHQMKWLYGSDVEIIHRLLYTFSSNINGVSALIERFSDVLPTFGVYLRKVCEDEPHLIHFSTYYNSLRAIIPVIDVVIASLSPNEFLSCFKSDTTIFSCLIQVAWGCQIQINEFPLVRGILADLNVCFKDLIKIAKCAIENLSESSLSDLLISDDFKWLSNLECNTQTQLRDAFITCCLNDGDMETKASLISICNRLCLSKILESITSDG